jgi:hypothetical protein
MVNVLESTLESTSGEIIVSSGVGSHTPCFSLNSASNLSFLVCTEQVSDGVYECRYVPRKTKKQVVNVNFGGVAVPGSPFRYD